MKRNRWVVAVIVLVLVLVLAWAFSPTAVPADFATVERGPLLVTIDEEGETRVRDRYVISAPVSGRLQRIGLEPGDPVVANQTVLANFLPADPMPLDVRTRAELEARVRSAEAALGGARAERERVQAELAYARTELERQRALAEAGAIARERLEAAEQQVRVLDEAARSAEFAVRTADHQLELARAGLMQAEGRRPEAGRNTAIALRSPVDGVVLRRLQESEAVVPAGQPLLEVGNLTNLEIVADLLSTEAVRAEPGQRVLIEQWGGGRTLEARVRRIEPSGFTKISALGVEEQRVNVIIDFEDPPEARGSLGDGFRVEVRIVVWEREDVLKVPTSALFRHEGRWAVYRLEDGRAALEPVEIGQRTGLDAEVLSGLSAGDRVIVYPSDAIRDGVAVRIRD
jgi:HlyD family secretion protein